MSDRGGGAGDRGGGAGPPLRVGTYNLWVAHWPATPTYDRAPLVRAALDAVDVLGTQEGTAAHLTALTGRAFAAVGRSRDGGTTGEHAAILYRTDRVEVIEHGDFWLSPTPEVPSTGWDAPTYRRLCTWARLRDRATGSVLVVLNAHLDHEGARARVESAHLLLTRAAVLAGGDPVAVTGDLNADPGSEPLRVLLGGGLADARARSATPPVGPETTFTDLSDLDRPGGRRRIDWVLVGPGVTVDGYAVLDARPGGRHPSDHDPVVAALRLPPPVPRPR